MPSFTKQDQEPKYKVTIGRLQWISGLQLLIIIRRELLYIK